MAKSKWDILGPYWLAKGSLRGGPNLYWFDQEENIGQLFYEGRGQFFYFLIDDEEDNLGEPKAVLDRENLSEFFQAQDLPAPDQEMVDELIHRTRDFKRTDKYRSLMEIRRSLGW